MSYNRTQTDAERAGSVPLISEVTVSGRISRDTGSQTQDDTAFQQLGQAISNQRNPGTAVQSNFITHSESANQENRDAWCFI